MESSRELSIQITLGGFSFCVSQNGKFLYGSSSTTFEFESIVGDASRYTSVVVGWSTDAVLLVPATIFDPAMADDYLWAANLVDPLASSLYNGSFDEQIVAVWSVDAQQLSVLQTLFPAAYHYHLLQVDVQYSEADSVRVSVVGDVANVVISTRDGLYAAESIRFSTPEDLLFFVTKANMVDKFARHSLEFMATDVEQYRTLFMRYFSTGNFVTNDNFYHSIVLRCE